MGPGAGGDWQIITWAVSGGLISGVENGALSPQSTATRTQVATILMRDVENLTR